MRESSLALEMSRVPGWVFLKRRYRGKENEITMNYHPSSAGVAFITRTKAIVNKDVEEMSAQPFWKTAWRFLKNSNQNHHTF